MASHPGVNRECTREQNSTYELMSEAFVDHRRLDGPGRQVGDAGLPPRRPRPDLPKPILPDAPVEPTQPVVLHGGWEEITPRTRSERAQWILNGVIAVILLILLSPLLLLVAITIKLSSRGPVLYTQTRIGIDRRWGLNNKPDERRRHDLGGAPFKIYKFRTMYVDAEERTGEVWATRDDPRVTPLGRFLRQYRIDEVPQLINVLFGDMHIVGPRPERPGILAELRRGILEYPVRQRVKPGITGLAQISQNYDTSLDDVRRKVQYDIQYLQTQSVTEDFRIMAKTVPVILFRRGGW